MADEYARIARAIAARPSSGVPLPTPDPRGASWIERALSARGITNEPENGLYIPADAFMRKQDMHTIDKIIDPNEVMRQSIDKEMNGGKFTPWLDMYGQRFT